MSKDNVEKVESISSLPKVTKESPIPFSSKELDYVKLGKKLYDVNYEGNVIIGDGRSYVDSFISVEASLLDAIDGEIKTIGVLHFDEYHNPKKKMAGFKTEQRQLISIDD